MGQYYEIVNLDKRQYIDPHEFGDGAKLTEFGMSGYSIMFALSVLLADGNGRGGGDLESDNSIVGTWAGDRIVITGDYADDGKYVPEGIIYKRMCNGDEEEYTPNLYDYANNEFYDVSAEVLAAMLDDTAFRNEMNRRIRELHLSDDVLDLLSDEDYEGVVRLYNRLDNRENGNINPIPPYVKTMAEAMIRWKP